MSVSEALKAKYTDNQQHSIQYYMEFYHVMEIENNTPFLTLDNSRLKTETVSLKEGLCDGEQLSVGDIYTAQITFDAADITSTLCGKYMRVYQLLDDLTEPMEIGRFIVTSVNKTSDRRMKTIIGYDYTCLWDEDGMELLGEMKDCTTVDAAMTKLSDHYGLSWDASGAPGTNIALSWEYDQVSEESCTSRDIARMLGQLLGGWIKADRNGRLYLKTVGAPALADMELISIYRNAPAFEEYLTSTYDNVTFTDTDGTIYQANSIGVNAYDLSGNYFLIGGEKEVIRQHLSRCLEQIKGIQYYPCEMTVDGRPYLQAGDYVKFTDDGKELYTLIKTRTLSGIQGLKDTYAAEGIDASVMIGYSSNMSKQTNLYIIRERYERKKMQQDLENRLNSGSGMYLTKEYNEGGEVVAYCFRDKADPAEATFAIRATMQAIGFSTDGGVTYPFGATINGDVVANILDAIGINADWINTGSLVVGGTSANADGAIAVYDTDDNLICQINKDGFRAILGAIAGWKITDNAITSPDDTLRLDSGSGTITGYEDGKRRVQLGKQGVRNYDAQGNLIGLTGVTDLYGVNDDGTLNYDDFKGSLMSTAVEDDAVGWAITAKVDGSGIDAKQRRVWYERATDTFHFNCKTEINGGFSGGTRAMEQTVLWEGIQAASGNIDFTESLWNYDLIVFTTSQAIGGTDSNVYMSLSSLLQNARAIEFPQYGRRWGGINQISDSGLSANRAPVGIEEGCSSYLKRVVGLKFTARINYSTSEQCIGTWIDGKPLYMKTYIFDEEQRLLSNTWFETSISVEEGFEKIISVKGMNSTGTYFPIAATADTPPHIRLISFRNTETGIKYLTLEYTKTTD